MVADIGVANHALCNSCINGHGQASDLTHGSTHFMLLITWAGYQPFQYEVVYQISTLHSQPAVWDSSSHIPAAS